MMSFQPMLTVIMPVYNTGKYLSLAIESVLNQTFTDFEFVIFDDCSTDDSQSIIKSFKDDRIVFIQQEKNVGYVKCLNDGLKLAKGKYIARMDSDDIALKNRFLFQLNFLELHPEVGVCGTFIRYIGNFSGIWTPPIKHEEIVPALINGSVFCHPSVIFRRDVLVRNNILYDEDYYLAEDYYMWFKLHKVTKLYNYPEILLHYRVNDNQVSSLYQQKQKVITENIVSLILSDFFEFEIDKCRILEERIENAILIEFCDFLIYQSLRLKKFEGSVIKKEISLFLLSRLDLKLLSSKDLFKLISKGYVRSYNNRMKLGLVFNFVKNIFK